MKVVKRVLAVVFALILVVSSFSLTAVNVYALSENARYYEAIPETAYAITGEPFVMYYDNIISLPNCNVAFDVPSSVSKKYYDDRIELTPNASGDYKINWRVYDSEYVLVDSGVMKLVARKQNLSNMTLLVVGDSTVKGDVMTQEMLNIFEASNSRLTLIGSIGSGENVHEGRDGWTAERYCTRAEYGEYQNLFYNNGFDFSYYMRRQGNKKLDAVIIQLGINDIKKMTLETYSSESVLNYFENMVLSIGSYNDSIPIILTVTIPPSSREESHNDTAGRVTPFEYRNNIIRFASELMAKFKDYENVYFSPVNCIMDGKEDYNDAIHPSLDGYQKMGAGHVSLLNAILNKTVSPEPTTISSCKYSGGVASISWVAVKGAKSYDVIRSDAGKIATVSGTTSYKDAFIEEGNIYEYKIRTNFENGIARTSKSVSLAVINDPELVSAANSTKGVKVTWKKVTGAEKYIVYRKTTSSSWKALKTVTGTSYVDTTAVSGNKYIYTVRAVLGSIKSGYNKSGVSVYYLATPTLSKPTNNNGSVSVKWKAVKGAKGYRVYRKTSKAGKWTLLSKVSGTSYTDKNIKSGSNYFYTVRAYNGNNLSSFNSSGAATKYLATPTLSKAVSKSNGVTVAYKKVTGATGYNVYRKTNGSSSWKKLATVSGNSKVSYLDKSAKKGVTYTYTVRAVNGNYLSYYNTKGVSVKDKY